MYELPWQIDNMEKYIPGCDHSTSTTWRSIPTCLHTPLFDVFTWLVSSVTTPLLHHADDVRTSWATRPHLVTSQLRGIAGIHLENYGATTRAADFLEEAAYHRRISGPTTRYRLPTAEGVHAITLSPNLESGTLQSRRTEYKRASPASRWLPLHSKRRNLQTWSR